MAQASDRGWFYQLASDLTAAILTAGFNKGQLLILAEIIGQAYGVGRASAVQLVPSDIARRRGMESTNVTRAIRELVKAGVLRRLGGHAYHFEADWERWQLGEEEGPREARVTYARDAPRMARDRSRTPPEARPDPPKADAEHQMEMFPEQDQSDQHPATIGFDRTHQPEKQPCTIDSDRAPRSIPIATAIDSDRAPRSIPIVPEAGPIEERTRGIESSERGTEGGREKPPPSNRPQPGTGKAAGIDPKIARLQREMAEYEASIASSGRGG